MSRSHLKLSDINLLEFGHSITLIGAIYQGGGATYLIPLPDEQIKAEHQELETLDLDVEGWNTFLKQVDGLLVEVSVPAKAIVRKCERQVSQVVSWARFRKDGYRCRYCGDDKVPLTVDHLVLWEDGGPTVEENLLTACKDCNRARGRTPYRVWIKEDKYYARVSAKLPFAVKEGNEALIETLAGIPLMKKNKSR